MPTDDFGSANLRADGGETGARSVDGTDRPECSRPSCDEPSVARWHDGMWTCEALCFEHVTESLDPRDRLEEYREELTTEENATTLGDGRDAPRVVPAGAKPFAGPWAVARSTEALREWISEHDEVVDL